MKLKIILLLSLIVCVVFAAGCLNNDSNTLTSINPLNKNIEPYESSFPENAPQGDDVILYHMWGNTSIVGPYDDEGLILHSDMAFYGTVKSIDPSYWATYNSDTSTFDRHDTPSDLSDMPWKITFRLKDGTRIEYNAVTVYRYNSPVIHTPVTFEVNDLIKGKKTTTATVLIFGGQVDNYILDDDHRSSYPSVWDLKEGQEYLVYIENNEIMRGGLFVVFD